MPGVVPVRPTPGEVGGATRATLHRRSASGDGVDPVDVVDGAFAALSGGDATTSGTDKLKLLWTEFNTGKILGTEATFVEGAPPAKSYKLRIYGADGMYLENGLNDLVKEELGEVFYYRGDPLLFHFPDGQAGVFIERTGVFYKITEVAI